MQLLELGHQLSHGAIPALIIDNKDRCSDATSLMVSLSGGMIQVSVVQGTYLSLCHLCVSQAVLMEDQSVAVCMVLLLALLAVQSYGLVVVIIALQHYSYRRQQHPQQEQEPKNSPMANVTLNNTVVPVHDP